MEAVLDELEAERKDKRKVEEEAGTAASSSSAAESDEEGQARTQTRLPTLAQAEEFVRRPSGSLLSAVSEEAEETDTAFELDMGSDTMDEGATEEESATDRDRPTRSNSGVLKRQGSYTGGRYVNTKKNAPRPL